MSSDHDAFFAAIQSKPQDHVALLVYADYLEEQGDARADYLRAQVEFRSGPTPELRQRLIELYPHQHLAWAATLEQAGALEANLSHVEFAWWGTDIGPARETDGTYERFNYHDQPPLPTHLFDGTFDWLRDSELEGSYTQGRKWKTFCDETRARGYFVPREFERFMSHADLPARLKSCTDNYFTPPPDAIDQFGTPSAERDDGLLVTFYADSQYCVLWAILLPREPGRYAPIIAGPPETLFPNRPGNEPPDAEKPVLAASQFEQFVYRYWIENEIWFATQWQESLRPLTPVEQAYLDRLNRKIG